MKIIMKKIKTLLLLGMFATASTVWAEGVVPDTIAGTIKVTAKEVIYHAETTPNLVMIGFTQERRSSSCWLDSRFYSASKHRNNARKFGQTHSF